ncbi:MAG TPA: hypothetical protein VLI04_05445 [Nocardioidaceae bacterium]|nr:hypothetical protein [Nocardioidaceae bacterium]
MTLSSLRPAGLLLAAAIVMTSCGGDNRDGDHSADGTPADTPTAVPLFPDDFESVCSGATQPRAADYSTTETHKAVYFETYEDALLEQSSQLPSDWTVVFDENSDAYAAVDVVGCGVRTAEKLAEECPGYTDEETGTEGTVNWYTGTYELTAYEAKTGIPMGTTTIEADDVECPMFATFDEGESEIDMYDGPTEEEIAKFLKPFVQP